MKAEAIGHAGPQVQHATANSRQAADSDSFSEMLQAIFAARLQSNGATTGRAHGGELTRNLPGSSTAKEPELSVFREQMIAQALPDARIPLVENAGEEKADASGLPAGDPYLVFLLQQWAELPPAAQETVKLILSGLPVQENLSMHYPADPGVLAELPEGVNATAAVRGFTPIPGEILHQPLPDQQQLELSPQVTDQLSSEFREQLSEQPLPLSGQQIPDQQQHELSRQVNDHLRPEFRQQPVDQQTIELIRQFLAKVTEPAGEGTRSTDLHKQLIGGPSANESGLTSQSAALLLNNLQEGKPLSQLPVETLEVLNGYLANFEVSQDGDEVNTGEKNSSQSLLARVEKFLQYLLNGGREATDANAGQRMPGEEQLKVQTLPPEKNPLGTALENESGRIDAMLSGRSGETAVARGFPAYTPPFQPNEVMAQVMERIALLARPGIQEMRLQLQPEHLGNILIRLRNVQGVLSAEVLTQHMAVKELLEGQLDNLRQRFQDMNLVVDEFRVLVGSGQREGRGEAHYTPGEPIVKNYGKKPELQDAVTAPTTYGDGKQQLVNFLA